METELKKLQEPIPIEQIDFRIQSINKGGYATILAYKNARVDQNRLDDVFGIKWQKEYKTIDNNLYCGIGIKNDNEWVWRWDVGVESYAEKAKGQASDSFKRAGFCWGIGRELYDYPFIQIKLNPDEFTVSGDKVKQTWNLKLNEWKWILKLTDELKIQSLSAFDSNGRKRFDSSDDNSGKKILQTGTKYFDNAKEHLEGGGLLSEIEAVYDISKVKKELEKYLTVPS